MKNSLLISLNVGILLSYIFTYYCHDQIKEYSKDLPKHLKKKYEKIRSERMMHFFIGVVLAVAISALFYKMSTEFKPLEKINIIVLIMLLLPMMVYKFLPKKDYMLKHSQKDQDYKDWFNIYLCMKNKSTYGFFAGFTISMVILNFININ
jgi:uncharacterized protein YacL